VLNFDQSHLYHKLKFQEKVTNFVHSYCLMQRYQTWNHSQSQAGEERGLYAPCCSFDVHAQLLTNHSTRKVIMGKEGYQGQLPLYNLGVYWGVTFHMHLWRYCL